MDKLNTQIRLSSNTSVYIVTTSKTTGLNSYLLQSLPTIMLQVLLLVFPHFFANKGYHLNITVHSECDIASSWAHDFAVDLNELQSTLKAEISMAQQRYQKSTNARCSSASEFKVGDKVFVKAKFFWTTQPSKKLSEKYLGPYKIIAQPNTLSFTLRLLGSMHSVHPVFHMSMLKPAMSKNFTLKHILGTKIKKADKLSRRLN